MDKLMLRPFLESTIRQSTNGGQLCLTDLANAYELERIKNGWVEKRLDHFFNRDSEIEYVIELLELQGILVNVRKDTFMELVRNKGLIRALKSIGEYKTKGRGENKSTFCNPYIFIAVAQWLNPKFRALVTIWVTDSLILNRIEAGHGFNKLTKAITEKIVPELSESGRKFIYSNFARLLNIKVFGKHDSELRQIASKEQLSKLRDLETELAALVSFGAIKSYSEAKTYIENK